MGLIIAMLREMYVMIIVNFLGRGCWVYPIYIASFSEYRFVNFG